MKRPSKAITVARRAKNDLLRLTFDYLHFPNSIKDFQLSLKVWAESAAFLLKVEFYLSLDTRQDFRGGERHAGNGLT